MGSMDCLTTVIGTVYFCTQELNPLIAELVNTNILAFVIIKLAVTFSVGIIFILAERALNNPNNPHDKSFKVAHITLRVASAGIVIFLFLVVLNNLIVLLRIM
jgi:ABC-type phosphate/phosphonate transport system permease subunit